MLEFYNYISKIVLEYISSVDLQSGDKYSVQLETNEQVDSLYNSLRMVAKLHDKEVSVFCVDDYYKTYTLKIDDVRVIIAKTDDYVKEDYLTFLRNSVDQSDSIFDNTAVLFIHNTSLDSILGGSKRFEIEGMPLNIKKIERKLKKDIEESDLTDHDKIIIEKQLEKNNVYEERSSIFDFQDIFAVLESNGIKKEQYKDFGLFYDDSLYSFFYQNDDKSLEERINENMRIFKEVDEIHKYSDLNELSKLFVDSDVNNFKEELWVEQSFDDVLNMRKKYIAKNAPEYLEDRLKSDNRFYTIWDRPDGETKSRQKKRHIILFNPEKKSQITLKLRFDIRADENLLTLNKLAGKVTFVGNTLEVFFDMSLSSYQYTEVKYSKYTFLIMVVNCPEALIDGIRDKYVIDINKKQNYGRILIIDDQSSIELNRTDEGKFEILLESNKESYDLEVVEKIVVNKNNALLEDIEDINLNLCFQGVTVPLGFKNELVKISQISNKDVWEKKNRQKNSFIYEEGVDASSKKPYVKLIQGTRANYPIGIFREYLNIEKKLIDQELMSFSITGGVIRPHNLELPEDLEVAYAELIWYCKRSNTLPSLVYFDDEYRRLAKDYIECYFCYLKLIQLESESNKNLYKALSKLGVVYDYSGDYKIHFTPLHPINMAYQLNVLSQIHDEDLTSDIVQYFGSDYLVPYVNDAGGNCYKIIDNELLEWSTYVEQNNSLYNASNKYVPKIVMQKIDDFVNHFGYLFMNVMAPLRINLVNLGDCAEIMQGIFAYYTKELKNKTIEEIRPIDLHIYDDLDKTNKFEELSTFTDLEEIEELFKVKLDTKNYDKQDVLSLYRRKVHFYKSNIEDVVYAHLTFYKMNDRVEPGTQKMDAIDTGLNLGGVINDLPSVSIDNEFVTGFGIKNLKKDDDFVQKIMLYNSFVAYINKIAAYDPNLSIVTAIKREENKLLNSIYEKSHWVTFIDPKVDLTYFSNDVWNKELMVIHYSDQYTSSSCYDAITVTQKSDVYIKVIEDFLSRETMIDCSSIDVKEIINAFNVFNGEWLLRLISRHLNNARDQYAREKLSLFAAVKLFEAYNLNSDVLWIPISLEELVRVSGSTGLSQKESLFSPKKMGVTGAFSDDVLMIGLKIVGDKIEIVYYPIEVKIGNNSTEVLKKAKEQVTKTYQYLNNEMFKEKSLHGKLLRNELIQQAISQLRKIVMYHMWDKQNWGLALDEKLIEKLLNDEYVLTPIDSANVNQCGVITFTRSSIMRRIQKMDSGEEGLVIDHFDYPMQDAFIYLAKDLEDIRKINRWNNSGSESDLENLIIDGIEVNSSPIRVITYDGNNEEFAPEVAEETLPINQSIIIESVQSTFQDFGAEMKINFGTDRLSDRDVLWYPNATDKVMHTNTGIIGTMGTGKTQFTKSLVTQLKWEDRNNVDSKELGILIFDYKGDYIKDDFVNATNATVYSLFELPFNPLSIYPGAVPKPMLPLHIANELRDTIANAYNLGNVQKNTLSEVLEEAYESVGILAYDPMTWEKPAPTIDTVFRTYINAEYPTNDSLYAALNELNKFRVFQSDSLMTKPLFELIDGVTVINLAGYSESIQNLVVAITLDTFYAQMQAAGHSKIRGEKRQLTKMILVDEADNFLSKNFNSIKKILKEGREFGVGTILSTQFLKHFSTGDNEYSQYVLTWVIHKVNEISGKEVGNIFSITNKSEQEVWVNHIKNLEKHHSIVNLGGDNKPKHIRDKAFWELI
ncbi:MAG: DNA phosphorothioation-dependent restriction protein DptH [Candidatus Delongbacteria bacterium]|nr:DNA phosphorothioation-dependent restriction protein DptH [Candidatus Delongbacteria bacterium]